MWYDKIMMNNTNTDQPTVAFTIDELTDLVNRVAADLHAEDDDIIYADPGQILENAIFTLVDTFRAAIAAQHPDVDLDLLFVDVD